MQEETSGSLIEPQRWLSCLGGSFRDARMTSPGVAVGTGVRYAVIEHADDVFPPSTLPSTT